MNIVGVIFVRCERIQADTDQMEYQKADVYCRQKQKRLPYIAPVGCELAEIRYQEVCYHTQNKINSCHSNHFFIFQSEIA